MSQDGMLHSRLESDLLKCHCHSSCASLLHKQSFSSCKVSQPSLLGDGTWRLLQSCSLGVFMQTHGVCWGVHISGHVREDVRKRVTSTGCKTILLLPGVREPLN